MGKKDKNSPHRRGGGYIRWWLRIIQIRSNIKVMAKTVGYMVTWTTYGSWLQGDKRKYVKDGKVLDGDEHIYSLCKKRKKWTEVKLT